MLGQAPWSASKLDTVEGCKTFESQVAAQPLEKHDPVTQDIWKAHGEQIKKRARGGDEDPELLTIAKRIRTTPLDESAGEGYHRSSNHEKRRAEHSSQARLKQVARREGDSRTLRNLDVSTGCGETKSSDLNGKGGSGSCKSHVVNVGHRGNGKGALS